MEDEIVIRVENVSKDFILPHDKVTTVKGLFTGISKVGQKKIKEKQHALKDISFEIKKGEFFGIVGRNGSGKSTLLKILAGIYQPTRGKLYTQGKLVPFIELGVGFNLELTGRENVYLNGAMLGFSEKEIDKMYDDIVSFAELKRFMGQKLKNYSSGMQVRLAFSMAIRANADILLIDEVLAVGDEDFQRKCFDYFRKLKKDKKTVIFVSHDMNSVREYCDRAAFIEDSKLVTIGPANEVAKQYSRMFIDETTNNTSKTSETRWGNGMMMYTSVMAQPEVLSDQSHIEIYTTSKAKQNLDEIMLGFVIKDSAGQNILGTNSQLERQKFIDIKKGDEITVKWTVPNIFSDGNYQIDPAIVLFDGQVCDWWEDAATFTVAKEDHAPYIVAPKINLIKLDK